MKKILLSFIALMTAMVMNAQVKQTYLTLNNGVQMPQFGLGVYSIPDGDETYNSVMTALKCGYRHIDTAQRNSAIRTSKLKPKLTPPKTIRFSFN